MTTFFGFAIGDSMFAANALIEKKSLTAEQAKEIIKNGIESCCNPSHRATISAMKKRYDIDVMIPDTPPRISLAKGDSIIVMGVRGLPRLTDRHEYTEEEIAEASFSFSRYDVK